MLQFRSRSMEARYVQLHTQRALWFDVLWSAVSICLWLLCLWRMDGGEAPGKRAVLGRLATMLAVPLLALYAPRAWWRRWRELLVTIDSLARFWLACAVANSVCAYLLTKEHPELAITAVVSLVGLMLVLPVLPLLLPPGCWPRLREPVVAALCVARFWLSCSVFNALVLAMLAARQRDKDSWLGLASTLVLASKALYMAADLTCVCMRMKWLLPVQVARLAIALAHVRTQCQFCLEAGLLPPERMASLMALLRVGMGVAGLGRPAMEPLQLTPLQQCEAVLVVLQVIIGICLPLRLAYWDEIRSRHTFHPQWRVPDIYLLGHVNFITIATLTSVSVAAIAWVLVSLVVPALSTRLGLHHA